MIKGFKVRINPTEEQKIKLIQFCGANRFIYNWVIKLQDENYKSGNKFIDKYSVDSMLTQLKKKNEFLDIFLASHCNFFISTGSGLDTLASIQNKPVVFNY